MLSKLVPDISIIILENVLQRHTLKLEKWRRQLPFLAVCQQWRQLALPIVYQTIAFESRGTGPKLNVNPYYNDAYEFGVIVSNIELVADLNCLSLANRLTLNMDYKIGLPYFMEHVLQAMHTYRNVWESINKFDACVTGVLGRNKVPDEFSHEQVTYLANMSEQTLPCISIMNFNFQDEKLLGDSLRQRLISKYFHQLTNVSGKPIAFALNTHFCPDLKQLNIHEGRSKRMPKINVDLIEEISMDNLVLQCYYGKFYSKCNNDSNTFVFKKLHSLKFKKSWEDVADADSDIYSRIYFPKLRVLRLDTSQPINRILTEAHYPNMLDKLVLNYKRTTIVAFNTRFGVDERNEFTKHMQNTNVSALVSLVNHLSANMNLSSELHMELHYMHEDNLFETMCFETVRYLIIDTIAMNDLVKVMSIASNIQYLKIDRVCRDVWKLSEHSEESEQVLKPFNNKIEVTDICVCIDNSLDGLTALFEEVIIRAPSLAKLNLGYLKFCLEPLVEKYKDEYPHVSALTITYAAKKQTYLARIRVS